MRQGVEGLWDTGVSCIGASAVCLAEAVLETGPWLAVPHCSATAAAALSHFPRHRPTHSQV